MRGHGALFVRVLGLSAALCLTRTAGAADPKTAVEVGSARAVAGQKVRGVLKVAESADGTPIVLPLTIAAGRKPGPIVWVQAATHGDEYGGARALQDVVRGLDPATMSGTLVAAMIANPPAFQGLSRVNPNWDDLMDSGDAFPGKDRFATERIAAAIHDAVRKNAEYFVDMHTGGDRFRQHPFVLYSIAAGAGTERLDDLARGFGVPTLWRDAVKIFPTSASTVFSGEGIPGFLLEVGGGQQLDPADVRLQADAIRSFLRSVGILPGYAARMVRRKIHDEDHREGRAGAPVEAPGTPLVLLDGVWVKPEYLNPSGSIKDRVAGFVLQKGLADGTLRAESEVVEPTSGNAGIALAYWSARLGLRAVVFMPENMTDERKTMIRAHGARLVLTPEAEGVVGAVRRARAYAAESPGRFLFDQFDDEAGVAAQERLGREAVEQAREQGAPPFDVVIAGVGTGGTIVGAGGAVKRAYPKARLVAVEPDASPLVCKQLFARVCPPPALP